MKQDWELTGFERFIICCKQIADRVRAMHALIDNIDCELNDEQEVTAQ